MATHFSILAWEILWREEPGRLQSNICRVGHNLVTKPSPHHQMIITLSLVNIHHLIQTQNYKIKKKCPCDENS